MNDKIFTDTNFIIYLFSTSEPGKRIRCRKLYDLFNTREILVWSTQVIQEFTNVQINKYKIDPRTIKEFIDYFGTFELVTNTKEIILHAIDIQMINQLSFWDSLIVAAAKSANCNIILSEDMNHGQKIEGILIQSPFKMEIS